MAKFQFVPLVDTAEQVTARLGSGTRTSGDTTSDADIGKLVKLGGDSRYDFAALGDEFEGAMTAFAAAPQDDYNMGTVQKEGRLRCTVEAGGTTLVVGDYVVAGTIVAKGTKLGTSYPKVEKATTTPIFKWRVIALYGSGAAGTDVLVEFIY